MTAPHPTPENPTTLGFVVTEWFDARYQIDRFVAFDKDGKERKPQEDWPRLFGLGAKSKAEAKRNAMAWFDAAAPE